jgi:predicted nucleic acid-binding protein
LIVYADTSFLFSLYVSDFNSSSAAAAITRLTPPLLITDFGEFEFTNAINWRVFRKQLRPAEERALLVTFSKDVDAGTIRIFPIPSATFSRARQIARAHTPTLGNRALDVLHVASAVTLGATIFCTFDKKQARLATAVGLHLL